MNSDEPKIHEQEQEQQPVAEAFDEQEQAQQLVVEVFDEQEQEQQPLAEASERFEKKSSTDEVVAQLSEDGVAAQPNEPFQAPELENLAEQSAEVATEPSEDNTVVANLAQT